MNWKWVSKVTGYKKCMLERQEDGQRFTNLQNCETI